MLKYLLVYYFYSTNKFLYICMCVCAYGRKKNNCFFIKW
jgi:hypothetical protein